jgi:hypothetical protein
MLDLFANLAHFLGSVMMLPPSFFATRHGYVPPNDQQAPE